MQNFDNKFLQTLKSLRLSAAFRKGEGIGSRLAQRSGSGSVEFFEHRPYTPGDRPVDIDWKLYSRTKDLFVKTFSPQEHLNAFVVIDGTASMANGKPSKLQTAKQIGAILGFVSLLSEDRLTVHVNAENRTHTVSRLTGAHTFQHLLNFLDPIPARGKSSVNDILKGIGEQAGKHIHLFLISDFMFASNLFPLLSSLKQHYFDITLIHLFAQEDRAPSVHGPAVLCDVESRERIRVNTNRSYLKEYQEEFDRFRNEMSRKAQNHHISFFSFPSDDAIEQIVAKMIAMGEIEP